MHIVRRIAWSLLALVLIGWLALALYAYWPGEPERPVAELAAPEDRFLDVDGLRLRYREYGERGTARADLLLIHGFANSLQSWRELAPRLAADAHVIAIDLPGYGLSSKPVEHDYHNGPQAEVVIAAARALGLRRPVYVGHSLGGAVALQAAVRDPQAGGLVLMNPGIITTGVPKIVQVTLPPLPRLSAKLFGDRGFRERFLKTSYVRPELVTPQVVEDVMLGARAEGYRSGMTSLMKQYAEGEEIVLAAQVRVPTLIAWGDRDRNKALAEADALQAMLAGSELVRFADAGHYVHEEAADGVAAALRSWLARHAARIAGDAASPGAPSPDKML
jgi:pimeloyl-ACP methyl ester carboxylesterase